MTKQNSNRKSGRPANPLYRELGITRLEAWKCMRLAEIPEGQFEEFLARARKNGRPATTGAILRHFGKLSPDRPRPAERGRTEALDHLEYALDRLNSLLRQLRETGSDREIALASEAFASALGAYRALEKTVPEDKVREA